MADLITRALAVVAPGLAVRRARARVALAHYEAASPGRRASWRPVRGSADATAWWQREQLARIARDITRNNPWAQRGVSAWVNAAVGDGIIPKAVGGSQRYRTTALQLIEQHCDTTAIDADGRTSLYGLQALAMRTVVESGECLVRHRPRRREDGLPLPFQLQVLEPEYLDRTQDRDLETGGWVRGGIEYDRLGRRLAYWLYRDHPDDGVGRRLRAKSVRVPASEVAHIYRSDRPGQTRGVSWLAPVATALQDLHDYNEAQVLRAKIAACFTAFRIPPEGERLDDPDPGGLTSIRPGRIQQLSPGEDIRFAEPPQVQDYDAFASSVLRAIAAGLGITYEALSGDLRQVNFSSARMGRLEMDRAISACQWQMLIPQLCEPVGRWLLDAMALARPGLVSGDARIEWVPPHRELVDPTREIPALVAKVRAGFASRSQVIRQMGYDPERVHEEIAADAREADRLGLSLETDPRRLSQAGQAQTFQEE